MQLDPLKNSSSVDAKTAQEALSLAIRMQQERGERVSIDELHRTADEAGIDRAYLESALSQVAQNKETAQAAGQLRRNRIAIVIAGAAILSLVLFALVSNIHFFVVSPALKLVICFVAIAATRRYRMLGGRTRRRGFHGWR